MGLLILYHLGLAAGVTLAFFLATRILRDRRPPAASLAWLLFFVTLPYLAVPLYLAIGVRKLRYPRKDNLYSGVTPPDEDSSVAALDRLLDSWGIPATTGGNRVQFHERGEEALSALWSLIDGAQKHLDIAIFILADDWLGQAVCRRLEQRVQEDIQVRLLLDGVGSFLLPRRRVRQLREAGVRVRWFIPVLHRPFKGRTNLRNHRKLVIADGCRVWTGGRNLAGEYFDTEGLHGTPWLDLSFELAGPGAATCQALFEADWVFAGGRRRRPATLSDPPGGARTRLLPSGPDMPDDPLQALILDACFEAEQRISIATPYFVPDEPLQEALCLAARRGVTVELLLPECSNHRLPDIARGRFLRELDQAGVQIWLQPGVMNHAKALVIDRKLALCGSANFDLRSLYLNFEVVNLFYDPPQITWLSHWMDRRRDASFRFQSESPGIWRELLEGAVVMAAFQL